MFARFRQVRARLNVSLVETARAGNKTHQTHIANLGSVPLTPLPADRVRFWVKVHLRLATLSNRLDDKAREAILAAIDARIPIPTAEDQQAARTSGQEANAAFFAVLRDKHRGLADAYRRGAEQETAAAAAVDGLEAAYASGPMTRAEKRGFLKSVGMTAAELRHCRELATICEALGEDRILPVLVDEGALASDRAIGRAVRSLLAASPKRSRCSARRVRRSVQKNAMAEADG
jgi:hypothetical protein